MEDVKKELKLAIKTWLPFISRIWSIVMIIFGTLTGAMACHKVRSEEQDKKREEQEQDAEVRFIQRKRKEKKDQMLTKVWNKENKEAHEGLLNGKRVILRLREKTSWPLSTGRGELN